MSFHNQTLLGGGGSAPGTPLTLDEEEGTKRKLSMLTADPINSIFEDREFKIFKTKQFERAYPGKQKLGATGRGIDMPPVVRDVEPFKPTLRRDDLSFAGAVGEGERNRPSDVIRAKKALANTGLFDFDVTKEKSTDAGPLLRDSAKAFQRLNGIKADGCIKPNCPTHKALDALFFPDGSTNSKASPVDLRPVAARAGAAAMGAGDSLLDQAGARPPAAGGGANGPTFLAQAKTPQRPGAPIGSGIKKPSGPVKWPSIVTRLLQREGGHNPSDPSNRGVAKKRLMTTCGARGCRRAHRTWTGLCAVSPKPRRARSTTTSLPAARWIKSRMPGSPNRSSMASSITVRKTRSSNYRRL